MPGYTELAPGPSDAIKPLLKMTDLPATLNRRVILIATATINSANIFSNGLFQNIYLIYRMAEAVGWLPIFVVSERPKSMDEVPKVLHTCRIATIDEIVKQPIPVGIYLEIGMSIDTQTRQYIKMLGARICKLYLGNILNIDIETPVFYYPMTFIHHSVGAHDEIWVSPHYQQHAQYAAALNHVVPGSTAQRIAPYIWDQSILMDEGRRQLSWRPTANGEKPVILIMEPNISFQKSALVPLMAAEAFCRKHPDWDGEVLVVNGEKLLQSQFFLPSIYQHLQIAKTDKLKLVGRRDMKDLMGQHPNFTAVCHQVNNDYNYMTLELLHTGFPLIHNASSWSEYGYYYKENDIDGIVRMLEFVQASHLDRLEVYKSHGRALAWKHSLYNPDVQRGWKELLDNGG
jgi:hypothetical protein